MSGDDAGQGGTSSGAPTSGSDNAQNQNAGSSTQGGGNDNSEEPRELHLAVNSLNTLVVKEKIPFDFSM